MNPIAELVSKLFKPVADIFAERERRKAAREAAQAKLAAAKVENLQAIELNKDEWEQLAVQGLDKSWKDEYATVSVVSIFNLIVVGGVAAGFGHPEILQGVGLAVQALSEVGADVGFLLEAVILAALGLSVWKRV